MDEEDAPDSESDFESDDETSQTEIKLTPLKLHRDHNLDPLYVKLRSSLKHFSNNSKGGKLISQEILVKIKKFLD